MARVRDGFGRNRLQGVSQISCLRCRDWFTVRRDHEHRPEISVVKPPIWPYKISVTDSPDRPTRDRACQAISSSCSPILSRPAIHGTLPDVGDLPEFDPDLFKAIQAEADRQEHTLSLIAAENVASDGVLRALGSVLTNKYAEGYPGRRFYGGCEVVDTIERMAIARAKRLFGAEHVNVQPHSGSQANMAVLFVALRPGDVILGPGLSHGGHLTAGDPVNYSGRLYSVIHYGVRRDTERVDFDEVRDLARRHRPKLIIAGGSAFPRAIDYRPFREIGRDVEARLLADIAHPAGLIAAGLHPSPVGLVDFVTTTTHETLRGPSGGVVICQTTDADVIDRTVMPGIQGGPHMHAIAAKAAAFLEASTPEWVAYQRRVLNNARTLADELQSRGYRLVTGGTDTHMLLVDLSDRSMSGRHAQEVLDSAGITVNKNPVPYDRRGLLQTSGIRLGTPAVTSRGMGVVEMRAIARLIDSVLTGSGSADAVDRTRGEVFELTQKFPLRRA
jgi:glycine hydroxymethyltransferase